MFELSAVPVSSGEGAVFYSRPVPAGQQRARRPATSTLLVMRVASWTPVFFSTVSPTLQIVVATSHFSAAYMIKKHDLVEKS